MSDAVGTIRSREAKDVVVDILQRRSVPKWLWSSKGKAIHILVGSRPVAVVVPARMTFYGLEALTEQVERICDDIEAARRHRGQIDLEDAIAKAG